jgi:DNA-binding transcriptional ArsR family regulator
MKEGPSPLLPLVRSRAQAEVLTIVLLDADREWSLTELARRAGVSVSTAQREVRRAEDAGVVESRRQGNTRLVRANPAGVLTVPLTELLIRALGPKQVLSDALVTVGGVDAAFIFGSWAARYDGRGGPAPNDIDVLVIGDPDRDELDRVVEDAEDRLARPVQTTIRIAEWWKAGDDGLRREIAQRPLVELGLSRAAWT